MTSKISRAIKNELYTTRFTCQRSSSSRIVKGVNVLQLGRKLLHGVITVIANYRELDVMEVLM